MIDVTQDDPMTAPVTQEEWIRAADAGLPVYPGNRTRAEWKPIAEASFQRAAHLPDD